MENSNKLVVITGGTKGIGRAIAEAFAFHGYAIATCARNEDQLDELKTDLEGRFETKVHILKSDLSEKSGCEEFIEFVRMTGKPVEVLVNNTGVFIPGQVHSEDEGVLEQMIQTNLYSAYRISRGIIPQMKKDQHGHIFNICSTASLVAYPNGGSYCISKFALHGMSKVLREELKDQGIRVTSVMPGATYTASWEGVEIPEERFMKAEDVAEMIWATYTMSERTVVEDLVIRPQLGDL